MNSQRQRKIPVSRPLVGILALVCLVTGGAIWFLNPEGNTDRTWMWAGAFGRIGLVLAAFWFALPSKTRDAAWASLSPTQLLGLLLGVFALVRWPRAVIPLLIVAAVIGYFLRPRAKYRPPRTSTSDSPRPPS